MHSGPRARALARNVTGNELAKAVLDDYVKQAAEEREGDAIEVLYWLWQIQFFDNPPGHFFVKTLPRIDEEKVNMGIS